MLFKLNNHTILASMIDNIVWATVDSLWYWLLDHRTEITLFCKLDRMLLHMFPNLWSFLIVLWFYYFFSVEHYSYKMFKLNIIYKNNEEILNIILPFLENTLTFSKFWEFLHKVINKIDINKKWKTNEPFNFLNLPFPNILILICLKFINISLNMWTIDCILRKIAILKVLETWQDILPIRFLESWF